MVPVACSSSLNSFSSWGSAMCAGYWRSWRRAVIFAENGVTSSAVWFLNMSTSEGKANEEDMGKGKSGEVVFTQCNLTAGPRTTGSYQGQEQTAYQSTIWSATKGFIVTLGWGYSFG